jgi:hypothetical protein
MAVLVLLLGAQVAGTPDVVRRRRRQRQLAELEQVRADTGSRLEIDWLRYKELPKQELLERLGKYGWHHAGDQVGKNSWLLCFSRDPATPERPDPRQRLGDELARAQPDADGSYRLDSSQCAELQMNEVVRAAQSAGWEVERLSAESPRGGVVLTRPGGVRVDSTDGPFVGTSTPAEMRGNPAVLARAREVERDKGFDPLSETQLNRARERHRHWAKQFNRQVLLAFLYGFAGVFMLVGTVLSAGSGNFYLLLAISVIVLALCGIAITKATVIRKRRRAEVGDVPDAYEQLRRLHE